MSLLRVSSSVTGLLLATLASAFSHPNKVIESVSFGHRNELTPGRDLPGWELDGHRHAVEVLHNRVVLTPPGPGSTKGSMWTKESVGHYPDWTAYFHFRASGQEVGSGSLQLWYSPDRKKIDMDNIYHVPNFEGLVIVVDQYGGTGGKIRGFLNDGSVNFGASETLDSLAFGHCDYSYRNRGIPSEIKITNRDGLFVTVDGAPCFSSNKISLPAGDRYHFGITATTGENNPDSFEAWYFAVESESAPHPAPPSAPGQQHRPTSHAADPSTGTGTMDAMPGSPEMLPDRDADTITTQAEQFADLHNRVQGLSHHLGALYYEIKTLSDSMDSKHHEMVAQVQNIGGSKETGLPSDTVGKINVLHDRVSNIESVVNIIRNDLEGKDYRKNMEELHHAMSFLHHNFQHGLDGKMELALKRHGPSASQMIFSIIGFQIVMAVVYAFYKRKRHSQPKKYL